MIKMSLNDVKNFKGVRKGSINVNLNSIPKKGIKKVVNDRVKTAENVNNGTAYGLPTYVEINIGYNSVAYVELMIRLTEMIKDESRGTSYYTCFLEEKTLGTFKTSFDDLRAGKIEKIIEKELNRYFGNIEEVRREYKTIIDNMDEQLKIKDHDLGKALSEKQEFQFKYADEVMAHEDTKIDLNNETKAHNETKHELMVVKNELVDAKKDRDDYKNKYNKAMQTNNTVDKKFKNRALVRTVVTTVLKLNSYGLDIDAIVTNIMEKLLK